jgi:hypothetical protein
MTVRLKSFEAESGLSKNVSKKAQDRKKGKGALAKKS